MSGSVYGYNEYNNNVASTADTSANSSVKVGYFKLADDGDEALVRFNISSVDDLQFSTVHVINAGANKWLKVSCLNPFGAYGEKCPLCEASNSNSAISKAGKKVFLQALVSYKDKTTGAWSAAQPVIWERPAGFSKVIAGMLGDYGDLKNSLFKITRNGVKGDMKTTYGINYAMPTVFKPEMVPADFSAFDKFNIAKHSYWEKTSDELNTFLTTGKFPEVASAAPTQTAADTQQTPPWTAPTQAAPVFNTGTYTPVDTTTTTAPNTPPTGASAERNFSKPQYSF